MPPQRFPTVSGIFDCPEATPVTPATPNYISSRQASIHRDFEPYRIPARQLAPSAETRRMERDRLAARQADVVSLRQRIIDLHQRASSLSNASRRPMTPENIRPPQWPPQWPMARSHNASTHNLHRHRLRRQREDDTLGTVQDAVDRLNEATSDLTSILNEPLPQIITSDEFVANLLADSTYGERRPKKRKLDGDPLDHGPAPVYGHFGQVVPGRLRMSLMSCDGGQLSPRENDILDRQYWPENILKNDKSVYCTEKNYCNIILRHWKETPFTITKIVIKTPETGFTAPVQEGLIFVSMNSENLLTRTKRYRIRNHTPSVSAEASSVYPESQGQHARPSSSGVNWVPGTWQNDGRPPSRRTQFYTSLEEIPYISDHDEEDDNDMWETDTSLQADNFRHPIQQPQFQQRPQPPDPEVLLTRTLPLSLSLAPGYDVTTSCDDPSGDEEEPSSDAILRDRQRRNYGHDGYSSDEDARQDPRKIELEIRRRGRGRPRAIGGPGSESISGGSGNRDSTMSSNRAPNGHLGGLGTNESRDDDEEDEEEAISPHARFFIQNKRNVVSVKFSPAITGRYILIKLWSPRGQKNIDIQSVSVYGFAGGRYVPAVTIK